MIGINDIRIIIKQDCLELFNKKALDVLTEQGIRKESDTYTDWCYPFINTKEILHHYYDYPMREDEIVICIEGLSYNCTDAITLIYEVLTYLDKLGYGYIMGSINYNCEYRETSNLYNCHNVYDPSKPRSKTNIEPVFTNMRPKTNFVYV